MANTEKRIKNLQKMMEIAAEKESAEKEAAGKEANGKKTRRKNIIVTFDPEANLNNDIRVIRGKRILSEKF